MLITWIGVRKLSISNETLSLWLDRSTIYLIKYFRTYFTVHPIGQILNHNDLREFQHRTGLEHAHIQIHVKDAPKIDENDSENDDEVVEFIDKYITCSLPDKDDFPDLHGLVNTVQTHHHTTTCRKKKGVTCRFNAPWPPSEKTCITRGKIIDKNEYKQS